MAALPRPSVRRLLTLLFSDGQEGRRRRGGAAGVRTHKAKHELPSLPPSPPLISVFFPPPPPTYRVRGLFLLLPSCGSVGVGSVDISVLRGGGLVAETWTMGRKGLWFDSGSTPRSNNKKTNLDGQHLDPSKNPRGFSLPCLVPLSKAPYSPYTCSLGAYMAVHCSVCPAPDGLKAEDKFPTIA
ncbi:unnamed protein product [Pleuronectes platessa]|uniref:Uncharacterized protein n=1 Tax=Pleuronectes platessa TaxID=8262 RepID=A0A9N7Y8Y9_PLEPL|nr:unnamed protein product [Pleuronectes platessa]